MGESILLPRVRVADQLVTDLVCRMHKQLMRLFGDAHFVLACLNLIHELLDLSLHVLCQQAVLNRVRFAGRLGLRHCQVVRALLGVVWLGRRPPHWLRLLVS